MTKHVWLVDFIPHRKQLRISSSNSTIAYVEITSLDIMHMLSEANSQNVDLRISSSAQKMIDLFKEKR